MKKFLPLNILLLLLVAANAQLTFHNYSAETILGDTISMAQFAGKKVMVVNTASKCAYTYQYGDLQTLYTQYKQYNFEIIGFPCNDFAGQEPKDDSTINEFCTDNYGVTFQMMSKIEAVTGDTAPVFKWLQRKDLNGVQNAHIDWNFNKFLIDEQGHWVRHINSPTSPNDPSITSWIMSSTTGAPDVSMDDILEVRSANPASTTIDLIVRSADIGKLEVALYATDGRLVSGIYNGAVIANQSISYPLADVAPGMYILRLSAGGLHKAINYAVIR